MLCCQSNTCGYFDQQLFSFLGAILMEDNYIKYFLVRKCTLMS